MDIADLPAGGLKEVVAFVPDGGGEFRQRGQRLMNGVARKLRVGDMALHAVDGELAAHGAAAAVFDHVACAFDGGGLAHNAPVQALAALFEGFDDDLGAINRRAFFIAGQQKGDVESGFGRDLQKLFDSHDKGGDRGFHITGAAPVEFAVAVRGHKRRAGPFLERAGRHHIGVTCKNQYRLTRFDSASCLCRMPSRAFRP